MNFQTYETAQPWVVYTYLTPDPKHKEAFDADIHMECCVCGATETVKDRVPAVRDQKPVAPGYKHPERAIFLVLHNHRPLPHALTWAKPLLNIAAHDETLDVIEGVVRAAIDAEPMP